MNMDIQKVIFWISTTLMCLIFLFSAGMYFTKYEMVAAYFDQLNYPTYLIYPLAIAKILGVIAIISNRSKVLKEWAYAGFFFDAVLAAIGHYHNGEGFGLSALAMIIIVISRIYDDKVRH
jgi:hypothetical protein